MSKNVNQLPDGGAILDTDKFYRGKSPFGTNDDFYATGLQIKEAAPVQSVNGQTGVVTGLIDTASTGLSKSGTALFITPTGVTANSYGSASSVPAIGVNGQGQIVTASDVPINITSSQVSNFNTSVDGRITNAINTNVIQAYSANLQGLSNFGNSFPGQLFLTGVSGGITTYHTPTGTSTASTTYNNLSNNVNYGDQVDFTSSSGKTITLDNTGLSIGYYFIVTNSGTGNITFAAAGGNTITGPTFLPGASTTTPGAICRVVAIGASLSWYIETVNVPGFTNYVATGLSSNVDLTNATNFPICPSFISVSFTASTFKIIMPSTSAVNAAQLGKEIVIKNAGILGQEFAIVAQDGSTNIVATVQVGDYIRLELTSTGTANGSWNAQVINSMAAQSASGLATSNGIVKYDGTKLLTSTTALVDASDRMTNSSQPLVAVYLGTTVSNATGDSTNEIVVFDTVQINRGTAYNTGTGTFTAPVAGRYQISGSVAFSNLAAGHTSGIINVTVGGVTYQVSASNYGAIRDVNNNVVSSVPIIIANLNASDTVVFRGQVGGSTKTVGFFANGATPLTFMNILLLAA